MLQWILENTLIAIMMAGGVCLACRVFRARPAVCHFLWVLVLVRLVAPPISFTQWPPAPVRSQVAGWFDQQASALSTHVSHYLSLPGGTHRADNRSVGSSSAASVQPNPIEPALLPEEPARAADPAPAAEFNTEEVIITNGAESTSTPTPKSEPPSGYVNASDTSIEYEQASKSEASPPQASDATMSERKRSEMVWEEFYNNKKAILGANSRPGGISATLNAALRTLGWTLAAIWILGAIIALIVHSRRIARFHRAVRQAPTASDWLTSRVQTLANELGTPVPAVRLMPGLSSPVIWGFGRPTLLWPADDLALAQRDGQRCDGIIVHELAHLRRRDHWLAWFEMVAISLLWWHPLAHLACRRLHEYADLACDSWVVSMLPAHRRMYAASIVDLIEQLSTAPRAALALGVGTSSRRALVERRLIMIVKERTTCRLSPVAALLALTTAAFLVPSWAGGAVEGFAPPAQISIDSAIAPQHQALIKQAILKRRAEIWFDGKDWNSAASAYQAIVDADPENIQAAQRLSACLIATGNLDRAQRVIRQSIDKGKDLAINHYNLACVLAMQDDKDGAFKELHTATTYGFSQLDLVNNDEDLESLRDDDRFRTFAGDALIISSLQKQANDSLTNEKWADAAAQFTKLTKVAPNNSQAQHLLSYSSILASRDASSEAARNAYLDGARTAQQKQIELGNNTGIVQYNMACVDAIQGKVESGLNNLARSIELGFKNAELMREDPDLDGLRQSSRFDELLASVESVEHPQDQVQQAIDDGELDRAAELIDKYAKAVDQQGAMSWKLGYALFGASDYAKAEQAFTNSLKRGHEAGDAVYNLACCQALRGNTSTALAYLDASVDVGYTDGDHMRDDEDLASLRSAKRFEDIVNKANDASVLQSFGAVTWEGLLERSREEIAADSTNGKAQHHLGWALLRLGRHEEAMAAFTRQRELGFAPQIATYNTACCQVKLGHNDAALDILAQLSLQAELGAIDADLMANDPDLKPLRSSARFDVILKALTERMEQEKDAKAEEASADGAKVTDAKLEVGSKDKKPGR